MVLSSQPDADCFAWQEFIGLNWPASASTCGPDPSAIPADFGKPVTGSVTWETYKAAEEVFQPDGKPPSPWCSPEPLPASVLADPGAASLPLTSQHGFKPLTMDSKFAGTQPLLLDGYEEAGTDGAWLTAQNGHLTMYEIRINKDEFNYIDKNQLYNPAAQQSAVTQTGINLPDGTPASSAYGTTGSIELKASWIELDNPAQWPLFKTSEAVVVYPNQPTRPTEVVMGLVGLHIIHKTALGQQFIWATFEHVNNDPSMADVNAGTVTGTYTYYNPSCNYMTDHYHCKANAEPDPSATDTYSDPIQVERVQPIPSTTSDNVMGLNEYAWNKIAAANPDSVFKNYELVNVLWPNNNTTISSGATVPLTQGDPQPPKGQAIVANTTMETYFQGKLSCLDCHASAPIAALKPPQFLDILTAGPHPAGPLVPSSSPSPYAADYSFLLSRARELIANSPTPPHAKSFSATPELLGGAGLVVLAAIAWLGYLAGRRRRPAESQTAG